jgi:hypothetical protein
MVRVTEAVWTSAGGVRKLWFDRAGHGTVTRDGATDRVMLPAGDPALEALGPDDPVEAVAGLAVLIGGRVRLGLGLEAEPFAGAAGGDGVQGDHLALLGAGAGATRHTRPP